MGSQAEAVARWPMKKSDYSYAIDWETFWKSSRNLYQNVAAPWMSLSHLHQDAAAQSRLSLAGDSKNLFRPLPDVPVKQEILKSLDIPDIQENRGMLEIPSMADTTSLERPIPDRHIVPEEQQFEIPQESIYEEVEEPEDVPRPGSPDRDELIKPEDPNHTCCYAHWFKVPRRRFTLLYILLAAGWLGFLASCIVLIMVTQTKENMTQANATLLTHPVYHEGTTALPLNIEMPVKGNMTRTNTTLLPHSVFHEGTSALPQKIRLSVKADILMRCEAPLANDGQSVIISDICWLNENTLIMVGFQGKTVARIHIDNDTKSCKYDIIASGYGAYKVACSRHTQLAYVINAYNGSIMVYDFNTKGESHGRGILSLEWRPHGVTMPGSISVNKEWIVVSETLSGRVVVNVYDTEQHYHHWKVLPGKVDSVSFNYLTPGGVWFATVKSSEAQLLRYDLPSNSSKPLVLFDEQGKEFVYASGVCGGPKDATVLVCDRNGYSISVFSDQGKYLTKLKLKLKAGILYLPWSLSSFEGSGSTLLAVSTDYSNIIDILALQ